MNYQKALETVNKFRSPEKGKLVANNTRMYKEGDSIFLKLHKTNIIEWKADGSIVLNSGGYKTRTTKQRINEYLPQHVYIRQINFVWYVEVANTTYLWADGFTVNNSLNMVLDSYRRLA